MPSEPPKYYFWFSDTKNNKKSLPENFENQYSPIDLSKNSHTEYVVNEKSPSANISVKKIWVDQNEGNAEANVSAISFELYQKITESSNSTKANDDTSGSISDQCVGTYTIRSDENWQWNSENEKLNLPLTGTYDGKKVNYSYYVKEVTGNSNNYHVLRYDNNEGITNGNISITNQINNTSYVLPETGGTGTNRFTAVGLALMAGSLMCGYAMRRKRREGREI